MIDRLLLFLINCFMPPLAVMILAGVGTDCLINTLFFIAGVIPGHIHGFYVSQTFYHRQRKVRKGRYPGGRKTFIYSERIWNGGATNERVRELYEREQVEKRRKEESMVKRSSRVSGSGSGKGQRQGKRLSGL